MPTICTLDSVIDRFKPGLSVFVSGMSGECLPLFDALKQRPDAADGVQFRGVSFPGINRSDYFGLHENTRQRAYFMQSGLRSGLEDGRAELLPLDYPGIFRDLAEQGEIDIAFVQVSSPDQDGQCSLGVSCDFQPAVWQRAKRKVALINTQMPRTRSSFQIAYQDIDDVVECDFEVLRYDGGTPSESMQAHANLIASLVRDGDTLEFGVGKLQAGVLAALKDHQNLKVWSGMVSTPVLGLLDSGAIKGKAAMSMGVALGDANLYERAAKDDAFFFRPVSQTHDVREISKHPNFCGINSAVEVDLLGQVNADALNGRFLAGVGGLPAYAAAAALSQGGRSIIALPAATDDGRFTRIVATLGKPGACAIPRHAADYVVTEQGIASLRGLSVHQRAKALIGIAAPAFRDSLEQQWAEIRARF